MKNIEKLYVVISKKVESIDFEALWPGFHRYEFALYTKEKVYLGDREIPWDDRFFGNTTILFEGKQIAIWNMEEELAEHKDTETEPDIDILTANMVHEMFHAFQLERGEMRFPDDMKGLDYPMTAENFRLKHMESKVLADAFSAENPEEKRELLLQFQMLREMRRKIYESQNLRYEYFIETVEGMAEYAGTKALRQLSPEKYQKRMEKYLHILRETSENLFEIRRFSYYAGTVLLLVTEQAGILLTHDIGKEKETTYELLRRKLTSEKTIFENFLENRRITQEKIIHDFMANAETEVSGAFEICGYDPMNMFKLGNLIYGSRFFMLHDREKKESIRLAGEAVLITDTCGIVNKYFLSRYYH